MMSVLVSHPTGNTNTRAVLRGLSNEGLLHEFHTTLALPPVLVNSLNRVTPYAARFQQRTFTEVGLAPVIGHPGREIVRQAAKRLGWRWLDRHESGWASVDSVYKALDERVASRLMQKEMSAISAVYAYEDGAEKSFLSAKRIGATCLYDLPSAHWRAVRSMSEEEADRMPAWKQTMQGLKDSDNKRERKDVELGRADRVFVASSYSKRCLTDHFGDALKISVTPYGCPFPLVERPLERLPTEPLRLIYAGRLTQPKGIGYLIIALRQLEIEWHLTLMGARPIEAPSELDDFMSDPRVEWLGSVPHNYLLEQMTKKHVFVFPSLSDGFGLVLNEALAAGLPVITTPNTAGPDIMTEGREGFIVPIRDPDAIAQRITQLADDETLRRKMAFNAIETARRSSWAAYERQIAELVKAGPL